jgi:hypothetical protein
MAKSVKRAHFGWSANIKQLFLASSRHVIVTIRRLLN